MIEAAAYSPISVDPIDKGRVARGIFGNALAVGLSGTLIAALWLAGHGSLLRLAIPAAAFFVGLVLYFSAPICYVEYTLWLWFLTPLVRRLVDWHFGYVDPSFILLSPLLVSGIGGISLLRPNRQYAKPSIPASFVLCGAAVLYAVIVDALQHPSLETVYGFADWLCPLLFGVHFYLNWDRYEEYRKAVTRAFLCGVPVLGIYGLYQFFAPPAWDHYWLESVYEANGIASSFGKAEPFLVRVWSTMNAPGPFANTMMVGLLLLLVVRSPLRFPAAVTGYVSFLLSAVRTAWLSWLLGLLLILKSANPRFIVRLCLSIILLAACVVPLASDPQISRVISDRIKTFSEMRQDDSFKDRAGMYRALLTEVTESPFGDGFENKDEVKGFAVDSGILITLFTLGWVGSLVFGAGVAAICLELLRQNDRQDRFSLASKAIAIAIVAQVVGGNVFVNVTGAMFWMFAGLCMSANQRQRNQTLAAVQLAP
jgi:hypothetical protein